MSMMAAMQWFLIGFNTSNLVINTSMNEADKLLIFSDLSNEQISTLQPLQPS